MSRRLEYNEETLDIRDLREICDNFWKARNKWFNIGLGLNLEVSDLEEIRQTNRDNVDDCFRDMLKKWLRISLRPTQSNLIIVLREKTVGFNQLAEELKSKNLKRDRILNQFRMASTNFMTKTSSAPSLVKCKSVIKICALMLIPLLLLTMFSDRIISSYIISPENCYATGSGLEVAVVGEKANAVLHLVNQRGGAYTKQVEAITCELIHKLNGITKISDCKIMWKTNHVGQYEISYQPTYLGRHQLHIKVEEEHIKGSPFPVTVKLPVQKLGAPVKTISGLKHPCGVAVNQRGEIIVAEESGHCISIFSPTGEKLQWFGSQGSGPGQFNEPHSVTVDDDDNILVADTGNNRIQKFTSDNDHITSVGSQGRYPLQFHRPTSVAISPITKKIAISDWNNHRVQILNPDLTFHSSIGSRGSGNGQFNGSHDVAFDSAGSMYVTDVYNHRIQVFNPEGQFLRQFGKRGKNDGELKFPAGITIDSDDTVYVAEAWNHRVSVFTHEGKFLTSFGSKGGGPGKFSYPHRISMDKNGIIYVADSDNNRIQIF